MNCCLNGESRSGGRSFRKREETLHTDREGGKEKGGGKRAVIDSLDE